MFLFDRRKMFYVMSLVQERVLIAVIFDIELRLLNRNTYRRDRKWWTFGFGYEPKHKVPHYALVS